MRIAPVLALAAALLSTGVAAAGSWKPRSWVDESTIELRTTCPGEGEHWFKVWMVVLDDQVYVRLGTRAAKRIACNIGRPWLAARIAGEEFDHVLGAEAAGQAPRVADAMAKKYWSDVLVRHFSHPLTLRLTGE